MISGEKETAIVQSSRKKIAEETKRMITEGKEEAEEKRAKNREGKMREKISKKVKEEKTI